MENGRLTAQELPYSNAAESGRSMAQLTSPSNPFRYSHSSQSSTRPLMSAGSGKPSPLNAERLTLNVN